MMRAVPAIKKVRVAKIMVKVDSAFIWVKAKL